jgi:hypothetical protein
MITNDFNVQSEKKSELSEDSSLYLLKRNIKDGSCSPFDHSRISTKLKVQIWLLLFVMGIIQNLIYKLIIISSKDIAELFAWENYMTFLIL